MDKTMYLKISQHITCHKRKVSFGLKCLHVTYWLIELNQANSSSYFLHQTQVTAALSESQQHDQDHLTAGPPRVSPGKHCTRAATRGVPLCTVPEWIDGGLGTSSSP